MVAAVLYAAFALFFTAFSAVAVARGFNLLLIILTMIMPVLCLVLSFVFFLWGASLVIGAQDRVASEADRAPGSS